MRILLAGQKAFGAEVYRTLANIKGIEIVAVASPVGKENIDRLTNLAITYGTKIIPAGTLNAMTMPDGIDLIVAAHSHDFIGEKTRFRSRFGGIGYHPSLLPIHRGRDAIAWTIRMGDRITGGTVYRLSNRMDGGNVLAQQFVFVRRGITPKDLWRETLFPLGVKLLVEVVCKIQKFGYIEGTPQDERYATWEPSIGRPPAFRPDLIMIE